MRERNHTITPYVESVFHLIFNWRNTWFLYMSEGKRYFQCSICEASFSQESLMKRHITTVHEGKKPMDILFVRSYFHWIYTQLKKRHMNNAFFLSTKCDIFWKKNVHKMTLSTKCVHPLKTIKVLPNNLEFEAFLRDNWFRGKHGWCMYLPMYLF